MKQKKVCAICLADAEQKCSGCQVVHYCSREHQKQHWKQHKPQCTPIKVKQDDKFGRYLEATREIKAGDIVIKESPILTGPSQITPPVCLGCYKLLEEGKTVQCEKCGWPLCSEDCSKKEEHKPECYYTEKRGEKVSISTFGMPHPNYQCITILRCLYQRDHDEKLWAKIQALQSHCDDRRGTDKWNNDKKMIVDFIWKFFKLEGVFNEEEIMRCCGIVQINAHEIPLLEPEYVGVFDRISMVEHNCRANCNKSFTSEGEIILSAGVAIPSGAHISVCYTDPLWGTEARRHHLADTWYFECVCERCSDATELGTMYSAVKCKKKYCKGYLLPETFIVPILHKSKNPDPNTRNLDDKTWNCRVCKDGVSDGIIQQLLQDIGRELTVMPKGDPDACEKFINHCSNYLHPNHHYMTDVSLNLAQIIGQEHELSLAGVIEDRLVLKTQLCRKIADLLEILAPDIREGSTWQNDCSYLLHQLFTQCLMEVSLNLAQIIRQQHELYLVGVMQDLLVLKTLLCKKIANLLEILALAETRLRGSLLFELHAAVAETGRRKSMTEGPMTLLGYVTESRKILLESANLLRHEPPELPEGRLYGQAKINLVQMDELIRSLSSTLPAPM